MLRDGFFLEKSVAPLELSVNENTKRIKRKLNNEDLSVAFRMNKRGIPPVNFQHKSKA